ncbi:8-oxoguanine glycosylase ogg1 [Mortierella alpina]|nr:8-oxoguanine glycosylase ogg1 [Mortierella alpina]
MSALSRTPRKRALSQVASSPAGTTGGGVSAKAQAQAQQIPTTTTTPSATARKPKAAAPRRLAAPAHGVVVRSSPWISIHVPRSELDLSTTLKCGQSFRWIREHRELPSGEMSPPTWSCVLDHRLWCLREAEHGFQFRTFRPSTTSATSTAAAAAVDASEEEEERDREFLRDYLQLDVPLTDLYAKWSNDDANFKAKAPFFPGVRILRQDPVENLICFICSSNNNISRISQMASLQNVFGMEAIKLCQEYGPPITIPPEDADDTPRTYYGFPVMEELAKDGVEETLRRLGFGYRAKYIAKTAKMIQAMDDGEQWLRGLRSLPYEEAHSALLTLQGVGPKVADCICLMSLDKQDAIPVDTHVWQIAVRDYKFRHEGKVPKTITSAIYKAVGKHFVDLFGEYSGWASSVLFAADLRTIEGRVKIEDPDGMTSVIKAEPKEEAMLQLSSVKVEEQDLVKLEVAEIESSREDQDSSLVRQSLGNIKLEADPLPSALVPPSPAGRRQSKRRKGA